MELAGGAWIFLGFVIVFFFAFVYATYTRKGSGINQRPYNKVYGGAPGARGASHVDGRDPGSVPWSRGTR